MGYFPQNVFWTKIVDTSNGKTGDLTKNVPFVKFADLGFGKILRLY